MERLRLIVIVLLVLFTSAASLTPRAFDYFRLAQQWPAGYCTKPGSSCKRKPLPGTFTIHGLWPSNYSAFVSDCGGSTYKPFGKREFRDLDTVWPDLKSDGNFTVQKFWEHEYEKHATCCIPPYTQNTYFKLAVTLRGQKNILQQFRKANITPGNSYEFDRFNSTIFAATNVVPDLTCAARRLHPHSDFHHFNSSVVAATNAVPDLTRARRVHPHSDFHHFNSSIVAAGATERVIDPHGGPLQLYEVVFCYDHAGHGRIDCPPTNYVDENGSFNRSSSCLPTGNEQQLIYFAN